MRGLPFLIANMLHIGATKPHGALASQEVATEEDFGVWAAHIAQNWPKSPNDSYNCFDPSNFQSHFLAAENGPYTGPRHPWPETPDFIAVNKSYWDFDFVGLSEFYHESKCLLFHHQYVVRTIHLSIQKDGGPFQWHRSSHKLHLHLPRFKHT